MGKKSAAGTILAALLALGAPTLGYGGTADSGQVAKGAKIYAQHCALCHGATLLGGDAPPLVGQTFAEMLEIYPLTAPQLYQFITSRMPGGRPGQLNDTEYLQVFSYVLHLNGYELGNDPLTEDQLKLIPLLPHPRADKPNQKLP